MAKSPKSLVLMAAVPCQMCSSVLQLQVAKMKPDQFRFAFVFGRFRFVPLETQPAFQSLILFEPYSDLSQKSFFWQADTSPDIGRNSHLCKPSPKTRPTMNHHRHQWPSTTSITPSITWASEFNWACGMVLNCHDPGLSVCAWALRRRVPRSKRFGACTPCGG